MAKLKQLGMAAGTFSAALGIGFVMQNGDALANRFGADPETVQPARFVQEEDIGAINVKPTEIAPIQVSGAAVQPQLIAPAIELVEQPVVLAQVNITAPVVPVLAQPDPVILTDVIVPEATKSPEPQKVPAQLAAFSPEELPEVDLEVPAPAVAAPAPVLVDCMPVMASTAMDAAMVSVSISAPCHKSTSFVVHHQGMKFSASTNDAGEAELMIPALAEVAVVIAAFADGDGAVATVWIPDFPSYDRAILLWQGDTSVMLSAYEGDAKFGDDGHITSENPGNMERLVAAEGGYLVQLGDTSSDDPMMAEVYLFPTGMMGDGPDVTLVAEAEITAENCGQELSAQSIQVARTGLTSALDLALVMPECDAIGDFLILQNMFEDLTLASR